jgi:hypothetical protein
MASWKGNRKDSNKIIIPSANPSEADAIMCKNIRGHPHFNTCLLLVPSIIMLRDHSAQSNQHKHTKSIHPFR